MERAGVLPTEEEEPNRPRTDGSVRGQRAEPTNPRFTEQREERLALPLICSNTSEISLLVGRAMSSGEDRRSAEVRVLAASLDSRPARLLYGVVGRSAGAGYPPRAAPGEPTGGDAVGGDEGFGRRVETGVGFRLGQFPNCNRTIQAHPIQTVVVCHQFFFLVPAHHSIKLKPIR